MFSNLNWWNILVLLLLALFIFGDKLPQVVADGMRMLRNLRRLAQDATSDLSREFGTEVRLEDLHPRTFVRKHLLSEEDQQALVRPFQSVSADLRQQSDELTDEVRRAGEAMGAPPQRPAPRDRDAPPAAAAPPAPAPPASYDDVT